MAYALGREQLEQIHQVLSEDIIEVGAHLAMLIDMAGNIIATLDNGEITHDVYSLAALAAGNFGAVSTMAQILGEEEFSILFHKGEKEHMHFSKVKEDFLLINIFGNKTSLGYLRLNVTRAIEKLEKIL